MAVIGETEVCLEFFAGVFVKHILKAQEVVVGYRWFLYAEMFNIIYGISSRILELQFT